MIIGSDLHEAMNLVKRFRLHRMSCLERAKFLLLLISCIANSSVLATRRRGYMISPRRRWRYIASLMWSQEGYITFKQQRNYYKIAKNREQTYRGIDGNKWTSTSPWITINWTASLQPAITPPNPTWRRRWRWLRHTDVPINDILNRGFQGIDPRRHLIHWSRQSWDVARSITDSWTYFGQEFALTCHQTWSPVAQAKFPPYQGYIPLHSATASKKLRTHESR